MKAPLILLICFLFFGAIQGYSQSATAQREKVHLHLDKPFYAAGDTIWLKAYVVLAGNNEPSDISKILYVDLFGTEGKTITKLKLPVLSGLANGDISLPDTLRAGHYRLRAYTNLMRNFSEAAFFEKDIELVNGFALKAGIVGKGDTIKAMADAQFFPESGELIAGLRGRVGIKVTAPDGKALEGEGEITDEANEVVAKFTTTYAGIGSFVFTPLAGKKYSATVRLAGSVLMKPALPAIKTNGYALTVNNTGADTVFMSINQTADIPLNELLLTAGGQSEEYFSARIMPKSTRSVVAIPRSQMAEGVTRITLSKPNKEPLAERLLFNDRRAALNLKLEKNNAELTLQALGDGSKPAQGSFSMAVVKADDVPYQEEDELSIRANLLLTSELKGKVEHPNYYFIAQNNTDSLERARQLDNLMLTQGWRKFVKTDTLNYEQETGLNIKGKLLSRTNLPIPKSKVTLYATNEGMPLLVDTLTNAEGRFTFADLEFNGRLKYLVQTKDVKNKATVKVTVDTVASPAPPMSTGPLVFSLASAAEKASKARFDEMEKGGIPKRGIVLKEVAIKAKQVYSSSGVRSRADKVITMDRIKDMPDLGEAIRSADRFIDYLNPSLLNGNPQLTYKGVRKVRASAGFVVMIDGVMYPDDIMLRVLNPDDVESMEVFYNGVGMVLDKGVIVINTKAKNPNYDWSKEKAFGVNTFIAIGYSVSRQFYEPKFKASQSKPDLRDVIYWQPNITTTDVDGKAVLKFYQGNKNESYRVIVEGISADGKTGRKVFDYMAN